MLKKSLIPTKLEFCSEYNKKILSIHLHANQNRFVNSDKNPILHVVRECPRLYYLSYIVRKGSPLLQSIDNIVRYAFEAGVLTRTLKFNPFFVSKFFSLK